MGYKLKRGNTVLVQNLQIIGKIIQVENNKPWGNEVLIKILNGNFFEPIDSLYAVLDRECTPIRYNTLEHNMEKLVGLTKALMNDPGKPGAYGHWRAGRDYHISRSRLKKHTKRLLKVIEKQKHE